MIPYRKFSDIQWGEFRAPPPPNPPKAPKLNDEEANDARTLDGLDALGAPTADPQNQPVRDAVVAKYLTAENPRTGECGAVAKRDVSCAGADIPYRKFSDVQWGEFRPSRTPKPPKAPKAPKVNDKQVNDARTLDGLGALAISCPKLADEPLRVSVVANHGSSKNTRAREDGAKPAKPAKAAKEGQQTGLSPGALPNAAQTSHPANWDAEDWRARFDERAGFLEHDGGLVRAEAEFQGFDCCVVEWLNQHPAPSQSGRCAWCGRPESPGAVVVPFGTEPGTHAWLHAGCWPAWYQRRREEAALALRGMGITMGGDHDD